MAQPQNQTNGNRSHDEATGSSASSEAPPKRPDPTPKEINEASTKIVNALADFPPEHARRALHSAASVLGVAAQPTQRAPAGGQQQGRTQNRSGNR